MICQVPSPAPLKYPTNGGRFAVSSGIPKLDNALKSNQEGLFRATSWRGGHHELSFSSAALRYLLPSLLSYQERCLVKIFL